MSGRRVGLFATCLVDIFRPETGFAAAELPHRAGCEVVVPHAQTCCGQRAWNSGDRATTRALVLGLMDAFAGLDAVVAPSGSCIGMLRQFPDVRGAEDSRAAEAEAFAARCFELTEFLVEQCGYTPSVRPHMASLTYHDSGAGLREWGIKVQPRRLLEAAGAETREMDAAEVCCDFGRTFCVKYPEVSTAMTDAKIASIERSDADLLVGGDLGCLLSIAGRLSREGKRVQARHVAEVLIGETAHALGTPDVSA